MAEFIMIHSLIRIFVLVALVLLSFFSCCLLPEPYKPPQNKTKAILFKCDNSINEGMVLPVDVIYITAESGLKEVIKIGPDAWFDSEERERWPFKQTLMLGGGEEILFRLSKPPETKFIVIFASFFKVKEKKVQQVILHLDSKEQEVVWVAARALYH